MGLFGKKGAAKEAEKTPEKKKEVKGTTPVFSDVARDIAGIIRKPHVTEKAAILTDQNVYTFVIHKNASKGDVKEAITKLYNVTPTKIHIVNRVAREYMSGSRGRNMKAAGLRKAYVYLKKGDRIELV